MNINITYLLRILNFKEGNLEDFFEQTGLLKSESTLDVTIALWDAEERGEVEIIEEKGKPTIIKDLGELCDRSGVNFDLADKLLRIVDRYYRDGRCINRNQLQSYLFTNNPNTDPKVHEYLCALEWLVDEKKLWREEVTVEADAAFKRPERVFTLITRYEHRDEGLQTKFVEAWKSNFTFSPKKKRK